MPSALQDLRHGARLLRALAGLQPRRHRCARDWHRGEHRDLQRHQHSPLAATAVSRRRSPGDRLGAQHRARQQEQCCWARQLHSLARDEPGVRGPRHGDHHLRHHRDRRRRSRRTAGAIDFSRAFQYPRRPTGARTRLHGCRDRPRHPLLVISDRLWKRRFGARSGHPREAIVSQGIPTRSSASCHPASRFSTGRGRVAADRVHSAVAHAARKFAEEKKSENKGEFQSIGSQRAEGLRADNPGHGRLQALIDRACLGEFETCKALVNLLNLGYAISPALVATESV